MEEKNLENVLKFDQFSLYGHLAPSPSVLGLMNPWPGAMNFTI